MGWVASAPRLGLPHLVLGPPYRRRRSPDGGGGFFPWTQLAAGVPPPPGALRRPHHLPRLSGVHPCPDAGGGTHGTPRPRPDNLTTITPK